MSFTFCTSGAAVAKAGLNVNSSLIANSTILNKFSDEAEGRIIVETRRDWLTNYASLLSGAKGILSDISSSLIAKQIISYDMSGYTSRAEAQTMLDVQDDTARQGIAILKDFKSNEIKNP